jgi:hypothetical protein
MRKHTCPLKQLTFVLFHLTHYSALTLIYFLFILIVPAVVVHKKAFYSAPIELFF